MANDLRAMAAAFRQTGEALRKAGNAAASQTARETRDYAKRLSSGPFSLATLAILDHPYAVRHHSTFGLDPSIINRQSGLFQADWRVENLVLGTGHVIYVVRNVAPYARYLEDGTTKMIARPMLPRLEFFAERTWERVAPPLITAALRPLIASY